MTARRSQKLAVRYYGPFKVLQKIGTVAYRLDLPPDSRIHPIFHVSKLKKKLGEVIQPQGQLPPLAEDGSLHPFPEAILAKRLVKRGNSTDVEVLIQWHGSPESQMLHGGASKSLRKNSQTSTLWTRFL